MIIIKQPSRIMFFTGLAVLVLNMIYITAAAAPSIVVLYPDVREPFKSVFLDIIKGINDELHERVRQQVLEDNPNLTALRSWLESEDFQVAITLGTSGLNVAQALRDSDVKFVVGAVLTTPDNSGIAGVTLIPDPEALFQKLKELIPEVRNIRVIYNPKYNQWLIDRAQRAANQLGMNLNASPAEDLREAATVYRNVLSQMEPRFDALWLPPDPLTVDERAILPLVLEQAWAKHLAVFSSNPVHVKRGVLFSLYPDNIGMGRSLATVALERLRNEESSKIKLLRDLLVAVNLRTADHLNIRLKAWEIRNFDLVFPSK